MKIAIVIPALNEAATIARVCATVLPYGTPVVVDDGSSDGTGAIARAAGAEVVTHPRNRGYEAALNSGFIRATELKCDAVVSFDADGQHDPGVLPAMLAPIADGSAEVVFGCRPEAARFGEACFNAYARLRFGVPDVLCGLKAYRLTESLRANGFDRGNSVGTQAALAVLRGGGGFATVAVPIHPREGQPRFGSVWRANQRLLRALWGAILDDLRGLFHRRTKG